jgi:hypothetical protein
MGSKYIKVLGKKINYETFQVDQKWEPDKHWKGECR